MCSLKLIVFAAAFLCVSAGELPTYMTPCSQKLSVDDLTKCVTAQAKAALPHFIKGDPDLGIEPIDPLALDDIQAKLSTFNIKSTNVILKGLKKMDLREVKWDFQNNKGLIRMFGNLTFLSDYTTEGRLLLIPFNANGKLSVKMYDSEILTKYKVRKVKGADGEDHIETYDLKASQTFGLVRFHMSNILGGAAAIGDTVNQIMNDNWRELMKEVGPPYVKAVANKVHEILDKLYTSVPFDKMFLP